MTKSIKLAVIDGDGVLWNNDARMAIADKAAALVEDAMKQVADQPLSEADEWEIESAKKSALWSIAFDPLLVELDRGISRNNAHTAILTTAGWEVVILSSNPEYTRERRTAWLRDHGYDKIPLILKDTGTDEDPRDRYIKTPDWKVAQVQRLIEQYGGVANIDTLLFVDDMQKNRDAISKAFLVHEEMNVIVTDSLDLAIPLVFPVLGQSVEYRYRINPEG